MAVELAEALNRIVPSNANPTIQGSVENGLALSTFSVFSCFFILNVLNHDIRQAN